MCRCCNTNYHTLDLSIGWLWHEVQHYYFQSIQSHPSAINVRKGTPRIVLTCSNLSGYPHAQVEQFAVIYIVRFTAVNNSQQTLTIWYPVDIHSLDRVSSEKCFSHPCTLLCCPFSITFLIKSSLCRNQEFVCTNTTDIEK